MFSLAMKRSIAPPEALPPSVAPTVTCYMRNYNLTDRTAATATIGRARTCWCLGAPQGGGARALGPTTACGRFGGRWTPAQKGRAAGHPSGSCICAGWPTLDVVTHDAIIAVKRRRSHEDGRDTPVEKQPVTDIDAIGRLYVGQPMREEKECNLFCGKPIFVSPVVSLAQVRHLGIQRPVPIHGERDTHRDQQERGHGQPNYYAILAQRNVADQENDAD